MMSILYWVMFVLLSIVTLASLIGYFGLLSSIKKEDTEAAPVIIVTIFFTALLFLPAREIFSMSTSVLMWKITNAILILISLLALIFNYNKKEKSVGHTLGFIITTAIGIIPFIQNVKEHKSTKIVLLGKTYIELILLGSGIFIVAFAILVYIIKYIRTQNRLVRQQTEALAKFNRTDFEEINSFSKSYTRMVREDINHYLHSIDQKYSSLTEVIKESNIVRTTSKETYNYQNFLTIMQGVEDIKLTLNSSNSHSNSTASSIRENISTALNNKTSDITIHSSKGIEISREIKHFLATPFSAIIAKTKIIKGAGHKNIENELNQIIDSITMCKSVISTYVNVSNLIDDDSSSNLSFEVMSRKAFEVYKTEFSKPQLQLNSFNIPEYLSNLPNDYLLCLFLPLIQNAVAAAPDSSIVVFSFDSNTFTLTNDCEGSVPSVEELNTPGYSSKENHVGSGIMIAKGLLNRNKKGELAYNTKNNKTVILTLQINKNNERN